MEGHSELDALETTATQSLPHAHVIIWSCYIEVLIASYMHPNCVSPFVTRTKKRNGKEKKILTTRTSKSRKPRLHSLKRRLLKSSAQM